MTTPQLPSAKNTGPAAGLPSYSSQAHLETVETVVRRWTLSPGLNFPGDAGEEAHSGVRTGLAISESETPSRNASYAVAVTKITSPWWPQTSMDRRLVIAGRLFSISMHIKQMARLFWQFPAGECHQNQLADATSFMQSSFPA
jgi:hypothetical protein